MQQDVNSDGPVLFYSPGACSLAVHIILDEIDKPFDLELMVTDKGETQTDKFKKVNPKGRLPVLARNDWVLTEAPAILLHLARKYPDFSPSGEEELSRTMEWFNWLSGTVHSVAIRQIWRTEYFTDDATAFDAIRKKGHEHLAEAHALIESRLGQGEWALTSGYTVQDPFLLVFYRWGHRMNLPMKENCPKWTKLDLLFKYMARRKRETGK
ncbi:MAG: glutathione S-transferase family protein [Granulosicoccus sp.]